MKATAVLLSYAGVLISFALGVAVTPKGSRSTRDTKEEISRPSFPFALPSFSLPGLNIPYLNALSQNRMAPRIRATKTEYMEVTRRQTVHPVCYTVYEPKAPCLPANGHSDFREDGGIEFDSVHELNENFEINDLRKSIEVTPTLEVVPTHTVRDPKYLEFKIRKKDEEEIPSSRIEGSEFVPFRYPAQLQPTEYLTKTVLITKLEKYTDRRVTATLVALNCLPVDRSIPMCQAYPSPIREAPDRRVDESDQLNVEPAPTLGGEISEATQAELMFS